MHKDFYSFKYQAGKALISAEILHQIEVISLILRFQYIPFVLYPSGCIALGVFLPRTSIAQLNLHDDG